MCTSVVQTYYHPDTGTELVSVPVAVGVAADTFASWLDKAAAHPPATVLFCRLPRRVHTPQVPGSWTVTGPRADYIDTSGRLHSRLEIAARKPIAAPDRPGTVEGTGRPGRDALGDR